MPALLVIAIVAAVVYLWVTSKSKARVWGIAFAVVGILVGGGIGIAGGGRAVSGVFVLPPVLFVIGCLYGNTRVN